MNKEEIVIQDTATSPASISLEEIITYVADEAYRRVVKRLEDNE